MTITSLQNPHIKQAVKLRDSRRARDREQLFIFEGVRELHRAITGDLELVQVFICPELCAKSQVKFQEFGEPDWQKWLQNEVAPRAQTLEVTPEVYTKIALRDETEGIVTIARSKNFTLADLRLQKNPLLIIVDNIEKPGNLGAIFRIADSAGADAVIITGTKSTDPWNPSTVRISAGTSCVIPHVFAETGELLAWLRDQKITPIATTPDAQKYIWECDMKSGIAIIMGSEAWGLGAEWLADPTFTQVKLPQKGVADSLNVAVATAITVFEAVRQRMER